MEEKMFHDIKMLGTNCDFELRKSNRRHYFHTVQKYFIFVCIIFLLCSLIFVSLFIFQTLHQHSKGVGHSHVTNTFPKFVKTNDLMRLLQTKTNKSNPLPNCLIIGARKCGTRALIDFINIHSQIRVAPEEVHFFDNDNIYKRGLNWYKSQMPPPGPMTSKAASFHIVAEKSPSYFISTVAPQRVKQLNPKMRLIVILRNPVHRVISDYAQMMQNRAKKGLPYKSLEQTVLHNLTHEVDYSSRMVNIGAYHVHLQRWLTLFPRHQIHIVNGDHLIKNPLTEMHKVEQFLGLKPEVKSSHFVFNVTKGFHCVRNWGHYTDSQPHCLGEDKGRKHPSVDPRTLAKLNLFYKPHNEKLFTMIGKHFTW